AEAPLGFDTGPLAANSEIDGGVPNVSAKFPHKGLFPGKDWKTIVPMVANALLAASARTNPASMAMLQNNLQMQRERQRAEYEMRLPQQVGGSMVQFNPETGGYETMFREPEPFEAYAQSLGYQPGTEEYQAAVQDYRLGAWSNPAVEAKLGLTGYRYDRQGALQEDRQEFSSGQQEDRQSFSNGQLDR